MRISRLAVVALAAAAFAAPAMAQDVTCWTVDPRHSGAHFAVRHLMVSTVRGEFSKVSGEVCINEGDMTKSTVDITIDATTVNTREKGRDDHLRNPDFLDVANHPTMTFKSKRITRSSSGHLQMIGDLTIRGVTKEATFDIEGPSAPIAAGRQGKKRGATATGKINRKDFGVAYHRAMDGGGLVVGDEVTITIDLEMSEKVAAPTTGS